MNASKTYPLTYKGKQAKFSYRSDGARRRGHFRSCDKDGSNNTESAIVEKPVPRKIGKVP